MNFTRRCLLMMVGCCAAASISSQDSSPNILFIYSDDQASWTVGGSGNPEAYTPNLDLLISEGAYLTDNFVTTPVCSPARASIMTSRYASELDLLDFIPQPGHILYDSLHPLGLSPDITTFPEVLQAAGYRTGLIGKWHLGDWTESNDRRFHPTNHGFDYFMGLTGGGTSPDNPTLEKDGQVNTFPGLTTDILTNEALAFIEASRESPFLLCLHYRAPHAAWLPVAPEDWAPYENLDPRLPNPDYPDLDTAKAKGRMREYLASTTGVDRNVGRLLKRLEDLGLADNTIVVFTSDHGYNMGHNGIEHKGNGIWITTTLPPGTPDVPPKRRPNLYDNSLKVPAIVRWPGRVPAGLVIDRATTSLDWYPTILALAKAEAPAGTVVRGRNLQPLLLGDTVDNWNEDVYAEYSMINYATAYLRSYRTSQWKLVIDFNDRSRDELYNVGKDPEENINLIRHDQEEVLRIQALLEGEILAQMKAIGDPLLQKLAESTDNRK
ncbi:MAG: sulfatase-like hydrolase/transferase [Lewinella sp.]